jgi:hypothetical protein
MLSRTQSTLFLLIARSHSGSGSTALGSVVVTGHQIQTATGNRDYIASTFSFSKHLWKESPARLAPLTAGKMPALPGQLWIGIDFLDLFINQWEDALTESRNQRIGLSHIVFQPHPAL